MALAVNIAAGCLRRRQASRRSNPLTPIMSKMTRSKVSFSMCLRASSKLLAVTTRAGSRTSATVSRTSGSSSTTKIFFPANGVSLSMTNTSFRKEGILSSPSEEPLEKTGGPRGAPGYFGRSSGDSQSFIACIQGARSTKTSCARGTGGWDFHLGSNSFLIFSMNS